MSVRTTAATIAAILGLTAATVAFAQSSPAPQSPTAAPADAPADAPATAGRAGRRGGGGGALAACRADMQALCGGVERGAGKKVQCLVDNKAKASAECQAAMASVADKRQGQAAGQAGKTRPGKVLAACQTDLATHCSASLDKPAKCLRQNQAKLSPECGAALKTVADTRGKLMAACQTDVTSLCGGQTKGREVVQCLKTNLAKLSPGCSTVVAEMPRRVKKAGVQ